MSRMNHTFFAIVIFLGISIGNERCALADVGEPLFEKSTLVFAGDSRTPIGNGKYSGMKFSSGKYSVSVRDGSVRIHDIVADSVSTVSLESNSKLVLTAVGNGVAYFFPPTGSASEESPVEDKVRIRRLNLKTSAWISDLALEPKPAKNQFIELASTYVDDEYFVAVVAVIENDGTFHEKIVSSYWVACFDADKSEFKWSKSFEAKETRRGPGVYLWSSSNPDYADAGLKVVTRFEDRLLISAESKQPIRCLNIDTGTELWRCERIWEFQRGFIGPSVWQHYIGRFRIDERFGLGDEEGLLLAKAKKQFNDNYRCSIIGGPAVVALKNGGSTWRGGYSLFVAVSKQPSVNFGGYLGDSVIYELSEQGEVISTTNLPRLVEGSKFFVDATGVTWKCQGNQLVRLQPSVNEQPVGPGGFDRQTDVQWIRTISDGEIRSAPAWLKAKPVCNSMVKIDRFAVSVAGGGYVETKGESLYQFPIAVTDLEGGTQKTVLLKVPFSNPIPQPESNYSKSDGRFETSGAYLLAITRLSNLDNRLQIVLGGNRTAQELEFAFTRENLLDWFGVPGKNKAENETDNAKDEIRIPDGLTLLDAADDPNTDRIKLLLANGADVNERSKNGWSALMSAACYGCKDVVETLIENGANVDFADKNCGGQTTLMWAARSGRSAKQKVKMLIDAGADIWKKTDGGSDLLASAAGAGNVEVVELLLEAGMKPGNQSDDGYTALMAAANHDSPLLVRLLVKAGAKVNTVDNQKKTALMFAAEGYDEGATIRALLELGADPNLKDAKGKTALDLCLKSQSVGLRKRSEILKNAMQEDN